MASAARSRSAWSHAAITSKRTPSASSVVSTRRGRQAGHHVGHVDERVAAVRVGEELLVAGLVARSRAPRRCGPGSRRPAARARSPRTPGPWRRTRSPAASRSASMASSTPGYWTLTATARSSWVMARWTWPIDADASGTGSHSANGDVGRGAELALDDARGQLGRHRRRVLLQVGQRGADVVGQPDVEVRRHLAELHEGALHAAERLGDLLGGAQLELPGRARPGARPRRTPAGPGGRRSRRRPGRPSWPARLGAGCACGPTTADPAGRRPAARRRCGRAGAPCGRRPRLDGRPRADAAPRRRRGQHLRSPARHGPHPTQR